MACFLSFWLLSIWICFHRITDWFGLEETLQITQFHPPALGSDPFHQSRLPQALPNLALNPAREGAATASLGNLGQGLTTLMRKKFHHLLFVFQQEWVCNTLKAIYKGPMQTAWAADSAGASSVPWQPRGKPHPGVHLTQHGQPVQGGDHPAEYSPWVLWAVMGLNS